MRAIHCLRLNARCDAPLPCHRTRPADLATCAAHAPPTAIVDDSEFERDIALAGLECPVGLHMSLALLRTLR